MGIYLPNMEMPRKGQMLVIFPDGTSYVCFNGMRERLTQTTAVHVQPHGDLIDRDDLTLCDYDIDGGTDSSGYFSFRAVPEETLNDAPVIIPAEK